MDVYLGRVKNHYHIFTSPEISIGFLEDLGFECSYYNAYILIAMHKEVTDKDIFDHVDFILSAMNAKRMVNTKSWIAALKIAGEISTRMISPTPDGSVVTPEIDGVSVCEETVAHTVATWLTICRKM